MKSGKVKIVGYWILTVLVAANYVFAGVLYIMQGDEVKKGMALLGYPMYFIVMLGVWKILGAIAIIVPGFARLKEWAYAGMVINLTSAAISSFIAGNKVDVIGPLVFLIVVLGSWALRPVGRKLASAEAARG